METIPASAFLGGFCPLAGVSIHLLEDYSGYGKRRQQGGPTFVFLMALCLGPISLGHWLRWIGQGMTSRKLFTEWSSKVGLEVGTMAPQQVFGGWHNFIDATSKLNWPNLCKLLSVEGL